MANEMALSGKENGSLVGKANLRHLRPVFASDHFRGLHVPSKSEENTLHSRTSKVYSIHIEAEHDA